MKLRLAMSMGLLLATNVAFGQQSALESLDTDSDGKVSVKEFTEYASARLDGFKKLDTFAKNVDANEDGFIDDDEFASRMEVLKPLMEAEEGADEEKAAEESAGHKVGDTASDFELQSIGKTIKLSDNFGDDGNSVVVVFSRANW